MHVIVRRIEVLLHFCLFAGSASWFGVSVPETGHSNPTITIGEVCIESEGRNAFCLPPMTCCTFNYSRDDSCRTGCWIY